MPSHKGDPLSHSIFAGQMDCRNAPFPYAQPKTNFLIIIIEGEVIMARVRSGNSLYIFTQYESMTCLEFEQIMKEAATGVFFLSFSFSLFFYCLGPAG